MFKQIVTLIRGQATDVVEQALDQQCLTLLRQQIRDCATAVHSARRAIAVAIAQHEQEKSQCAKLETAIADLEIRALSALEQGKEDLAKEAAETIARLEAERDASRNAQGTFSTEIARLKAIVQTAEERLKALELGQRMAQASEQTQRLRVGIPGSTENVLQDAEATLDRLQRRHRQMEATAIAMTDLISSGNTAMLAERMSAAGCGPPIAGHASDVLARLKAQRQ